MHAFLKVLVKAQSLRILNNKNYRTYKINKKIIKKVNVKAHNCRNNYKKMILMKAQNL